MKIKQIWGMIRETFKEWNEDKVPRLAAALSYYTVFALAPLLVLVIAIAGFIIGNNETIRTQLLTQIQALVGSQAKGIVSQLINQASRPRTGLLATGIGVITLLAGATGVFGQLQSSLNTIWNVEPKQGRGIMGMLKDRFLSFAMIVGVVFLLLVSLVISTLLSIVNHFFTNILGGAGVFAQGFNFIFSIAVITLIFAVIFKVLPDAIVSWRDVWVGALATAILFTIGRSLLSLYLGSTAATSAYGAAGSLVIFLLWVYYSAQILFMGAEFTQVYARHTRSYIVPDTNARLVTGAQVAQQGSGRARQAAPAAAPRLQDVIMPVTGQPDIHPEPRPSHSRVRYEPPNSDAVIPVIAAGLAAGVYTVIHMVRVIRDLVQ